MLPQNPAQCRTPESHYQSTEIVTSDEISVVSFTQFTVEVTCPLMKTTMEQVVARVSDTPNSLRILGHIIKMTTSS